MKKTSWLCWLLALSVICLSEAQYKFRRPHLPPPPPPLPPPQIFKKSWAPGPRISPMGNSIHMTGNFPHKRPLFKPPNYRFRRPPGPPLPPPMFNVLPSSYKNPMPPSLGMLNNYRSLGQSVAVVKELQSIAKVPQQYSPEYRPEAASLPSHRGVLDDDKGPIHTIPAPNLGPASKSYQLQQQQQQQALLNTQENKGEESGRKPYSVTQVDYASVFNGQDNVTPQRIVASNPTSTNAIQHQYEVTESNEVNSVPPTYFTPDFESAQYASSIIQEQQANDVYSSHPSSSAGSRSTSQLVGSSVADPSQSLSSMQTNLHSSMHVDTSESRGQQKQQQQHQVEESDLYVGQPGAAGPPMSAAKLYEVLNAFPQQLTDQYALNQQPQIQQHLLQQQLPQILQQQQQADQNAVIKATFSQPRLHSFNYDEQANKKKQQQQQNIFIDQNYASGRVTADYSLAPEVSEIAQEVNVADASEQQENNIEFENPVGHVRPTTYFTKIGDDQSVATQFYTTLPNRDAAEKLAALAAAGNVNSQLIGQLRKQQRQQQLQQQQQQQEEEEKSQQLQDQQQQQQPQADQPMPSNHKEEYRDDEDDQSAEKYNKRQRLHEQRQKLFYLRQKIREEQAKRDEEKETYRQQSKEEEKHALRILVPEDTDEKEKEPTADDYEYENDEADRVPREPEPSSEDAEFGSRIVSKNRK